MERFHLHQPTPLHTPTIPSDTGDFLTCLASASSTSFLSVGPCSPLQLWNVHLVRYPRMESHQLPLQQRHLRDIDWATWLIDGEGDTDLNSGIDPMDNDPLGISADGGKEREEDGVLKEKGSLDAGMLMRASIGGGLGVCTTSRGPLYLVDVPDDADSPQGLVVKARLEQNSIFDVFNVDVSGDGEWFGSVGKGEGLKVWREGVGGDWGVVGETELPKLEFGSCVRILGEGVGEVVVGNVAGRVFVVSGGEFVHTWNHRAHCGVIRAVDAVPDNGHVFVSGADDGLVNEWDLREENVVGTMGGKGEVTAASVGGPSGCYVGVGGRNGVTVWERRMRECVWSKDVTGKTAVWALTFCGNSLVWSYDDALYVLDCRNAEIGNV